MDMALSLTTILYSYGLFLYLCGIIAVIFIGLKAKTALISGGTAGSAAILAAYLISTHTSGAQFAGILITFGLSCVFAWRSTKTLHTIFKLIPEQSPELNGKGIAFLIISLMAVVSVFVTILQLALLV